MIKRMVIQVVSDLHLEFIQSFDAVEAEIEKLIPNETVDVLVLAGDISARSQLPSVLEIFSRNWPEVVFVPGNHEFYGSSFEKVRDTLSTLDSSNVHVLDNRLIDIQGQRIVGTTLWFPDHPTNVYYSSRISDFHRIEDFRFMVYQENKLAVDFLTKTVSANDIVITHHIPTRHSIAEHFQVDPLNRFFLCSMDELIAENMPRIWIHGHTHESFDYLLNQTRVICNPCGYPKQDENPNFIRSFLLEI